jgi:heme exporter protein C
MNIIKLFHQFISPRFVYWLSSVIIPYIFILALILIAFGLYQGIFIAPPDYLQGDAYRIIYIHVPAAYLSLLGYVILAVSSFLGFVWHIKIGYYAARSVAGIGAIFTVIALLTGAIWGKPMWGTYWQWTDPRMMSELFLLFLYLGYMALIVNITNIDQADRVGSILAMIGLINVPIIHYSVEWWSSIHQGPSIMSEGGPSIAPEMLYPLLTSILGFTLLFIFLFLYRLNTMILLRESGARWLKEMIHE